ncbi:MAG: 50S ribosomal protein L11 methyltransferase, partial [Abditibacteriota bacterium]|nr:50S ribosomal protein L11 methyltransferase [Abditibacteriota bacterium]
MNWAQLTIKATKATADAASEILCAAGCNGTSVTEASKNALLVTGYVARDGRAEKAIETTLRKLAECGSFGLDLSQSDLTVTDVADDDWGLSWRKFYKPLRVGKIVVKPTWEPFEANEDDVVVNVDPAMAFGTGNHPTTRLCLE